MTQTSELHVYSDRKFIRMIHYLSKFIVKKKILTKSSSFGFLKVNCKSWSIVFFGSDNYSLFNLKILHKQMEQNVISNMEVVVTSEKTPIYKYAVSHGIKTHFWPPNFNKSHDFGVIASFGKLIPKNIIEHFHLGIFNVHASLLPKYRGGMPFVHAIKNGETLTGVTVSRILHDKFDAGEIILQKPCSIGKNELMPSLYRKLSILGSECLFELINTLPECLKSSLPQSHKDASYAPILNKKAAIVKWDNMTAVEIFNLYRALFGLFELKTTWEDQPVKLVCLSLCDSPSSSVDVIGEKLEPGSFIYEKKSKCLYVQCKDKGILLCTLIFKFKMYKACDFYTGYMYKTPKSLWKFVT